MPSPPAPVLGLCWEGVASLPDWVLSGFPCLPSHHPDVHRTLEDRENGQRPVPQVLKQKSGRARELV